MSHNRLIIENQLDGWVRGNARDAQGVIVELVERLVAASSPRPKERRFPLGDSIGQPGPDGVLDTDFDFNPFVPEGRSFWEIGTGLDAGAKATLDYTRLTEATPEAIRRESIFVFVTPLSGRRDWPYTWKEDSQAKWLEERRTRNQWRDVRVIDGTRLIDWMQHFPAVERWLASTMGLPAHQLETPEQRWAVLRTIGAPPPLVPQVFLTNREQACEKLKEVFSGTSLQLRLDTHFPDQVVDFVCACVAAMDEDARIDSVGRCLIVSGSDAWDAITALPEPHVLIAGFNLDEVETSGTRLLEKARRAGHAVIFGGTPGGVPHPNRVPIPNPRSYHIREALEKGGYSEERARVLAQKCDGNLSSLLRVLQNLSLMPEWAEGSHVAELAIAVLLGSWDEKSTADQAIVEAISGKSYGEWTGKIREIWLRPGTPLNLRGGVWKIIARYEAWYALGSGLFDDHLNRLRKAAVTVLGERDPKFELEPDERFAAAVQGKVLTHSNSLRQGLAESLALLGSHPKALISCTVGKAEATAVLAIREVLTDADWVLWASLNDLLPLLAEAAPREFLDAVENALRSDPCPFDTVFAQESSAIGGGNYMTGLLWALETLAWDAEYLTRVIILLGELAARDQGGNWGNRPANSITTILLPWLPQTCASVAVRKTAVETLIQELPDITWKILLNFLPRSHQISSYTRRPAWREMINDDWSSRVSPRDYWDQVAIYAEMATDVAKRDLAKLVDLIDRMDDLPPRSREKLVAHLSSDVIISLPQEDRLELWTKLVDLVRKHRRFADAEWAMKPEKANEIAAIADRLAPEAPAYRHRRLFQWDFDLFEDKGDYDKQRQALEERRRTAILEVHATGGMEAILEFANAVERPWHAGIAFGMVGDNDADRAILPELLATENKSLGQFTGGFVWGRFRSRGWQWVDHIDIARWAPSETGQLLAYLPFTPETWERSARLLGKDESPYWTKTNADAYETDKDLEVAVNRLIDHGRPHAAIRCLDKMLHDGQTVDSERAVRALLAALDYPEGLDVYHTVEIIKKIQSDPDANPDDLFRVEWAYLGILDRHYGASPRFLEQMLADDPDFFCEVIRSIYRSKNEERPAPEPTEQQKVIAENAYSLLSEWRTPPGSQKDGTYRGEALDAWLTKVKASSTESGHLEVALTRVGHVLVYAPADPDGLWIHHSAAAALNAKDANNMRDGFRTELFNSRGVYGFTAGQEERQLAEKYRRQATEVESHGYHRLATSLRDLADSYQRESEVEASGNLFED